MTEINVEKLADPRFYLENFCKIKNKEGKGLVPFILKPAQLDIFNIIQKNNRVIIMKARQIGFCVSPHTKILLSNLEWTTVEDIKVGQGIVCVDEFPIKKGKGGMRKMREGVVEAKQIVYEDAFKLKMDNGSELTATGLHKFLFLKNKTETEEWKTVKEMSPGDSIRYITEVNPEPNFEDGWFSGMIDGEGSLSKKTRTGSLLSISQVDGPVWDRLVRYAEKNKYSYRIEIDKRIPQNSGKHGEQPVNKLIIGKMDELLRLFATTRPHRLINRKWWEDKQIPNNGWSKIISIEFLGKREMIDLQTSEKTFIANGFVSHNSTAVTGFLYHKTITTSGVTTALIGYNNDLTAELLDKIKTFYRTTPDVLKPTIHYNTKYEISFPKVDSKILVLPSTENVGRGYTINYCLCVSGDTEILTPDGGSKKMSTIREGDKVINGKGNETVVKKIWKKENKEELRKISCSTHLFFKATNDHEALVFSKKGAIWKKVIDLTTEDYLAYPITPITDDVKTVNIVDVTRHDRGGNTKKIKMFINPDYAFGLFCGWYLAEGCCEGCCGRDGKWGPNRISIAIHKKEVPHVVSIIKASILPYISSYSVIYKKDSKTAVIRINGRNFTNFLISVFGRVSLHKTIPDQIWSWDKDFCEGLVFGLFCGDGSITDHSQVILTSTTQSIIYQTKKMLASLGIGLAGVTRKESFRYGKQGRDRFDLRLTGNFNTNFRKRFDLFVKKRTSDRVFKTIYKFDDNYYYHKIKKISVVPEESYVYDLMVESKDHSFCLLSNVLKNCTEIPFWEKAEEKMVTLEASVPITGKLILESCVTGDTLVLTDKGLRYVRDIVNWDKLPLGISKSKSVVLDTHKTKQKINIFHKNGQREGYRITTASGNSIGMSKIHPLLVMRNGDLNMVKAEEMLEGDYIATKIGQNMWGNNNDVSGFKPAEYGLNKQHIVRFIPKEITPDLAYLMGVILGDGYIYKDKCVSITNNDKYIDTFLLSSPLGLKFFKTKKRGCFEYRCTNHSFVVFLRNFGFERGLVAKTKIIPNRALQMSRENIVALLQGLFDTDGISSNKVHGGGRNGFCSTSKQMIEVVRLLLLNLGIVSSFYKSITSPTKRVKVSSVVYKLQVSSSFSNKFYDEVGFRTERKQKNKKFIPSKQRGMVVPGIGSKLHKLLGQAKALGISGKFSRKSLYSKNGGITYGSLFKILQFIPDSTEKEMLINLYNSNYFYDKIIKKEKIKEEVYDFTVPKFHTFIANGFVSSNSPGAIGDYFHRMWVSDNDYIKKEYGWWWDYNEEEIETIRRRMNNLRKFNNNYALEFLISGRSVFTTEAIATQRKRVLKVGDKVKLEDGTEHIVREEEGFRIYKPEVKDHFYVFGCLPDGEKVLTNKGLMSIEDVRLTEKLIDKEGNLVNIKNIQRRYYEGEVYGINPNITVIETKFTPEHPILVLKDNKLYRTSKKKGGARFYKTDVTWKKAKDINKNDILKIPIRFKESLKNEEILTHFPAQDNIRIDRRIDPKIILTESFWFFIGFWLAEGWINNTNDYGITIHLSLVKEKDLAKKMCKEIRKLFNRNVTPCYRTSSNVIDIKFSSEVIYNFIKNNFGQKATGKDIKEWIKYLPSPLKIALFNGYRTGDGGTSVGEKDGRNIISCVSISKKLLYDFQEILLSLGLLSNLSRLRKSGIREIRGTKSFTQETYQLRLSSRETSVLLKKDYNFSKGRHIGYSWIEGNFLYLKIKKIDKYDYRGYVNNFETETHSYCAPMMVVHNCDCSEGVTGGDYSVAVILDRNTGEEVAMWRGLTAPDKFAKILDKWGRKYNNALMVVESEAHGNVVLNVLKQGLYPSLYFRPSRFDTIGNPFSDKLGWKTTKITRPILIDEFEMMTRQDDIILHSKETVDEMTTFIFNDANNMVAMQSYHDDQIFATAIAIQGFKVLSNKPMTQLNYSQHLPAVGY